MRVRGFVTELNPAGTAQLYSYYLCGTTSGMDEAFAIALDPNGKMLCGRIHRFHRLSDYSKCLIQSPSHDQSKWNRVPHED